MGLDMYAYIIEKSFVTSDVDFKVEEDLLQKLHYWRKHPHLHDWMERLYVAKGGQNPDFNLSPVALNSADLDALETAIKAGDLPETVGVFLRPIGRFGAGRRSRIYPQGTQGAERGSGSFLRCLVVNDSPAGSAGGAFFLR